MFKMFSAIFNSITTLATAVDDTAGAFGNLAKVARDESQGFAAEMEATRPDRYKDLLSD